MEIVGHTSSMASTEFDAKRAVQIYPGNKGMGSGYRIADKLVLTAKHIFENASEACKIKCHSENSNGKPNNKGEQAIFPAKKIWQSEKHDVALIEIRDHEDWKSEELSTNFTTPQEFKETTSFRSHIYPEALQVKNQDGVVVQGGHSESGTIVWTDESGSDLLPLIMSTEFSNQNYPDDSSWKGASGAAIFCENKCLAIIKEHPNPSKNPKIYAVTLKNVFQEEGWLELLKKYGLSTSQQAKLPITKKQEFQKIIKVELETILSANEPIKKSIKLALEQAAQELNEKKPTCTSEAQIASHIIQWIDEDKPHDVATLLDKVMVRAVVNYKLFAQKTISDEVNKKYIDLIGWLVPLALAQH